MSAPARTATPVVGSTPPATGPGPGAGGVRRRRRPRGRLLVGVGLALFCLVWIYPFLWVLSASFKEQGDIFGQGLALLPETLVWDNYVRAWEQVGFSRYFVNSVVITAATVALIVVRSALAGYVLGRCDFPGKKLVIGIFLVTFFLPEGYTIIPVTQLTDSLGLLNTHAGVVLGLGAGGHVAATLLYAGYFRSLPMELEESARVDGAGPVTIFFRIMLPLAWPVTATVIILQFLTAWNAYLLPLVFTLSQPDLRTLAVGMTSFVGEYSTDYSGLAAAAVISLLPVMAVFISMQRHFVDSIAGAVKQ
ncbi:carbohydrate ABC transporter permease [Auraticoccus monumenti]|uniref:Carbohydrate ABC transporter membrane protein 2, CUT1 family n=1 Tax=Auraticoccus monumenti TaxID=675864 RepID=A0A1G6ZAT7_9ACTN|nr:carbohydrate ABC transporter permease [Auraticoccus monumenti]SDD99582.1 carbohydrate ABC transporter membrane protein 2, CUT1 family [Auraticoccus monumenti]